MQRRQFTQWLLSLGAGCALLGVPATALARRGRPASPNSVAGVRRRHIRRRRRRVSRHMRLHTLPAGCRVTRVRNGITYYHCGGVWYRPAYQGSSVVYIVDDIDAGANTNVEFGE